MPSKGSRAASRQAKLREKKRRGRGAAQVFDSGPTESQKKAAAEAALEEGTGPRREVVAPGPARPARSSRRGMVAGQAPSYQYLGAELRRIGVIATVIFAMLVAASFFIGS